MLVFILLVLFYAFINITTACDIIETKVDFQLLGNGFHRTLKLHTNFSSQIRLINCRVGYLFQIPHGAFVDVDELSSSAHLRQHCSVPSRFNIEDPQGSEKVAQLQPIFFHSNRKFRKVFVFDDTINFPIHLRYHKPIETGEAETNIVEFHLPRIYLQCEENETLLSDQSCRKNVEKVPCSCESHNPKCAFTRLNPQPDSTLKATVPVGQKEHALFVGVCTLIVILTCCVYIFYSVVSTPLEKTHTE